MALFTVVACGGGATATPEAATQQAATQLTPQQIGDAFPVALNSGNLAAFNDILADDFVFTQVPGPGGTERVTLTGKSAYMIRLAGLIENNQQLTLSEQVYEGDNSSGMFSVTADNLKAIGVDSLTGTYTTTSKDGKLVNLDTVVDQASLAKLGAATAPPSAEQVVNAYMTALNGGNLDAIVELYADDIVFTFGPLPPENNFQTLTGKAENLADDADTITNNGQLLFSRTSEAGNTVKGEFSYTDDELKGIGVATITGTFESVVEQGKITSMKGFIDEKTQQMFAAAFAPPASRELTLLVGAGRDTVAINGFFPSKATVRAGDTVVWKQNSDEIHTVAFFPAAQDLVAQEIIPVPGGGPTDLMLNPQIAFPTRAPGAPVETFSGTGLVNSGIMSKGLVAPGAETFTLVLDTPGTYEYVCLIHPFSMRGTVIVEPSSVGDVPSQADIDAAAQAELAPLQAQITRLGEFRDSGKATWSEAGPNGTTIWHLQAGGIGRDHRVELIDFLAKDITIQEGDTVVWTASAFHQVTFHPGRTEPIFVVPVPQDQGPPHITLNAEVLFPAKPAAEFDGTGFWSSGILDIGLGPAGFTPGGSTFSMTFGKTGVFDYICAVHIDLGMEGTITVVERQAPPVAVFNATAGEFPEGLAVDQEGNIYAGLALTGEIRRYTPAGEETSFAQLPAPGQGFMVGMEFDQAGDLFVAMTSFDAETHGIWRVSPDGNSELFASLPVEGLPNVPVFNGAGDLFVSDTIGGAVWKIDPDGNVTTWTQDPLLLGNIPPGAMGFPIGSNGVAFDVDENHLYIAVTEKARIVRIAVNVDGSAGAAEVFAEDQSSLAGPDGITFGASGDLYVALAGSDAIAVISPEGEVSTLLAGGSLQNPSDIKFGIGDDANTLYIANFAIFRMLGFIPGTPQPALLKMQVDSP